MENIINDRQKNILKYIIEEHVDSGKTVGSKLLASKEDLDISPATIRNEMGFLEKQGFIKQPHTSAGRIPTEKAYKLYIQEIAEAKKLAKAEEKKLQDIKDFANKQQISAEKTLAKALAEMSEQAIIIAFSKDDLYYTGIANILAKPEFQNTAVNWGMIIDRFDEVIEEVFDAIEETTTLLGKENPFSRSCGLIATRFGNEDKSMIALLGPIRMDYAHNKALIEYSKNILS